jgi:hypothetical protein
VYYITMESHTGRWSHHDFAALLLFLPPHIRPRTASLWYDILLAVGARETILSGRTRANGSKGKGKGEASPR